MIMVKLLRLTIKSINFSGLLTLDPGYKGLTDHYEQFSQRIVSGILHKAGNSSFTPCRRIGQEEYLGHLAGFRRGPVTQRAGLSIP